MTPSPKSDRLDKLVKLLRLTTSSNDAEALLAVRKANEILPQISPDWGDLLFGKVTLIADPFDGGHIGRSASDRPPPRKPPPPKPTAPVLRPCDYCQGTQDASFGVIGSKGWYCSSACKTVAEPPTMYCPGCGKANTRGLHYYSKRKNRAYCSSACQSAAEYVMPKARATRQRPSLDDL